MKIKNTEKLVPLGFKVQPSLRDQFISAVETAKVKDKTKRTDQAKIMRGFISQTRWQSLVAVV